MAEVLPSNDVHTTHPSSDVPLVENNKCVHFFLVFEYYHFQLCSVSSGRLLQILLDGSELC